MKKAGCYIIAEAGINHNGSLETALKMVEAAVAAGADAVKFQTFQAEHLVTENAPEAEYQRNSHPGREQTQLQLLKQAELSREAHDTILKYCKKQKIDFLSTPFDIDSADFLYQMGLETFKIPSGEITNYPYLKRIGSFKKKIILSTGMSTLTEIKEALQVLKENGTEFVTVLHCNTEYPTPMEDANLEAIRTLRRELQVPVGYSDHTSGILAAVAAAAMGAVVVEKHFTLDRRMEGPDHKASLEPDEFKQMVSQIRLLETAMGTGAKEPSRSEQKNKEIARKSIVAFCEIRKGETFTEKNLTVKRPGSGISPMKWREILGKVSRRDYKADELLCREELEDGE